MYDNNFYNIIRSGCQASAAVVAPLIYDTLKPRTVIDVGCGEGWWGKAFQDLGSDVLGIDGDYVADRVIPFNPVDLSQPFTVGGRFDLAVCLEVAEHLPAPRATSFVADLIGLSDAVLFSAAIPGQGGVGHLNEQWPAYWVERFEAHGWLVTGAIRYDIWDDHRVENWYRQNLLLAVKDENNFISVSASVRWPVGAVLPLVHPVLWDSRR